MAGATATVHEHWSSRFTFIMAAVGSSVGLGNFWRFPYEAGRNGGGAFVIVYLFCVILVAMPLVMSELMVGRRGGLSAVGSARKVAKEMNASRAWTWMGWNGMAVGFLVFSFYSVIAGWIITYIFKSLTGQLVGADAGVSEGVFNAVLADWPTMILTHGIFVAMTVFIVWRGLKKGIEMAVNVLMPGFFVLLALLAIYSMSIGDLGAAVDFLFKPDFSLITGKVAISALGQAFFSVGVGVGIMLTYGAYLNKDVNIPKSAAIIALSDTAVAIIAGLLIFPIVFGYDLAPNQGPGLIFVTLPIAFGQMPFGSIIGALFFVLALVAAITSSISMLEIFTSWAEEHKALSRQKAATLGGLGAFLIGLLTVFSFNVLSDYHLLSMFDKFSTMTLFDLIDYVTGKLMMPLGGLMVAVFSTWVMVQKVTREELGGSDFMYMVWRVLTRYLAPIAVTGILLYESGLWKLQ